MNRKAYRYLLFLPVLLATPKLALANMNGANFDGVFEALLAFAIGIILNFILCVGNSVWKNMFVAVIAIILTSLQTVLAFYLLRLGGGAVAGLMFCSLEWYLIVNAMKKRQAARLSENSES